MPRRQETFQSGQYYHIYNRGVNRQPIFFCDDNWIFFLRRLRHYLKPELVDIIAYCLMPNHYHLLIFLKTDSFLKLIQPFGISYSKAINRQQERVGPLFQGPFQSTLIDKDEYLLHLSRYLHLNPVRAGLVQRPEDWSFSSYRDYIGLRNGTLPVPDVVLRHFTSREDYRQFVEAYQDDAGIQHLLFED